MKIEKQLQNIYVIFKTFRHLNRTFQPTNFIKFLQVLRIFQKLLVSTSNFAKLFTASTHFIKVVCESHGLFKVLCNFHKLCKRLVSPKAHVRFARLTFLGNLYIATTLLSGCCLQCFCIVTTCLQRPFFSGSKSGCYIQD